MSVIRGHNRADQCHSSARRAITRLRTILLSRGGIWYIVLARLQFLLCSASAEKHGKGEEHAQPVKAPRLEISLWPRHRTPIVLDFPRSGPCFIASVSEGTYKEGEGNAKRPKGKGKAVADNKEEEIGKRLVTVEIFSHRRRTSTHIR